MTKPKLLFICAIAPFPTQSGGSVRTYQTLKHLSGQFDIYFISFRADTKSLTADELKFLHQTTKFYYFLPLYDVRNIYSFFSHGQPFWFTPWYSEELKLLIKRLEQKEHFSLVQVDFSQLLYLAPFLPAQAKKIFMAHDLSTVSFYRRALEASGLKRVLFLILWWQIWWYEKKYLPQYNLVGAMSQPDQKTLHQHFAPQKTLLVPNGVAEIKMLPSPPSPPLNLGFIGPFGHTPNAYAVKFFIFKIAPLLEKAHFPYRYYLAGQNDPALIKTWLKQAKLQCPKFIINLGFVLNLKNFYSRLHILLVTLHSGSGTRLKILEALSFGKTVISTPLGAQGIDVSPPQLQLATTPKDFLSLLLAHSKSPPPSCDPNELKKYLWSNIFQNYHQQLTKQIKN
jgi:glycosyltransferase involved in cell wall biosynthesis